MGHDYVVQSRLDLVRGNMVRIEDGRGMMVRVASGEVWITEEGDPRDRFVTAGRDVRITSRGVTLVSALSRSAISLSPRAGRLARLRARLMHLLKEIS
jgi:ferric-dicitrate binding protein FerR (iron transport regulator)